MAELARIVKPLNGSATLRTASHAFSFGVIGFTCGPSRKREYQLINGNRVGQGTVSQRGSGLVHPGSPTPEAAAAAEAALAAMAAPAFLTWHGPAAAIPPWLGICARGASGSAGSGLSAAPAHAA